MSSILHCQRQRDSHSFLLVRIGQTCGYRWQTDRDCGGYHRSGAWSRREQLVRVWKWCTFAHPASLHLTSLLCVCSHPTILLIRLSTSQVHEESEIVRERRRPNIQRVGYVYVRLVLLVTIRHCECNKALGLFISILALNFLFNLWLTNHRQQHMQQYSYDTTTFMWHCHMKNTTQQHRHSFGTTKVGSRVSLLSPWVDCEILRWIFGIGISGFCLWKI